MDTTMLGFAIGFLCLLFVAVFAVISEALLKKERDKWREQFERRNRDNGEWL